MRSMPLLLILCTLIALAGCGATPASKACVTPEADHEFAAEVLDLINTKRAAEGLELVSLDDSLSEIAAAYACEMIEESFFAHVHPETGYGPGHRLIEAGYGFRAMGENLAVGYTAPESVTDAWLESAGHRAVILSPEMRRTGLAVRVSDQGRHYWVQILANPLQFESDDDRPRSTSD